MANLWNGVSKTRCNSGRPDEGRRARVLTWTSVCPGKLYSAIVRLCLRSVSPDSRSSLEQGVIHGGGVEDEILVKLWVSSLFVHVSTFCISLILLCFLPFCDGSKQLRHVCLQFPWQKRTPPDEIGEIATEYFHRRRQTTQAFANKNQHKNTKRNVK